MRKKRPGGSCVLLDVETYYYVKADDSIWGFLKMSAWVI